MIQKRSWAAFATGAGVGTLGGLIGLGGAEFRLPLLLGIFGFAPLEAVILNKAMSLIVVASALPFRAATVPMSAVVHAWPVIANLLAGSLVGAWLGAGFAVRIEAATLRRIIAGLLVAIALVLLFAHNPSGQRFAVLGGGLLFGVGLIAGFGIGAVAALLGVAGGELLIPTLVLLFGVDIKLAGSLSLAISLPTMVVAFARYSQDQSFVVLRRNRAFVFTLAAGSVLGTFIGGRLLGMVPSGLLLPILSVILLVSAFKTWRHSPRP